MDRKKAVSLDLYVVCSRDEIRQKHVQKRAKKVHDEPDFKIAYSDIRGVIFI